MVCADEGLPERELSSLFGPGDDAVGAVAPRGGLRKFALAPAVERPRGSSHAPPSPGAHLGIHILEIFGDESGIDRGDAFFLGSLRASPRRIEILRDRVKAFREATGCSREMKWTKVSRSFLPHYMRFVDIILRDGFPRIRVRRVIRDASWHRWDRPEEDRFWIAYYVFLMSHMNTASRYDIVLDHKPGKPYRWERLRFAMKAFVRRRFELSTKQVRSLRPCDSHADDILQLVDVFLGAVTTSATAEHKRELSAYVKEYPRIECDEWAVDLSRVDPQYVRRAFGNE